MSQDTESFLQSAIRLGALVQAGELRLVFFYRGAMYEDIESLPEDTQVGEVRSLYEIVKTP